MCNTNQYQRLKFTDFLGRYDHIVIPAIQRDYAQGREDKKATEVRKTLLDDIFSDKPEIDFNLVFGSQEEYGGKTCFIPVDGQQRLTTLFLLYLYNSKVNRVQTANLNKFTYETRRAAADFCKAIVDKDWENQKDKLSDSIKDCNWFMQYWNQDPTVISMLRMLDSIQEKDSKKDFSKKLDRITFYFYDLKQNGLNETLYIKMNGRGKPLTAFENLKAAIDNILPKELDYDFKEIGDETSGSNFKEKWQSCIDGKWTDAFWDKENPHNIDKNLTKFIVRFLSSCYAALKPNGDQTADDETKKQLSEINADENNYSSFIPFGPIKKVLESKESFAFLARAFVIISCKENVLYPTWRNSDSDSTFTINEKTGYKILSVLLAYVLFDGDKKTLRFAQNMAENTVSGYNDFINLCNRFGEIKTSEHLDKGIYTVLSNHKFNNPSEQLSEEIAKAKQILDGDQLRKYNDNKIWEDVIIEAENYAFFKGAIRFLFRNENGEWDWKDFDTKWGNVQRYFKKECQKDDKSAVNEEWDNAGLLRSLISKIPSNKFENVLCNNHEIFNNFPKTWKYYLLDKEIYGAVHQLLYEKSPSEKELQLTENIAGNIIYYLSKTNLLDYIIRVLPNSRIRYNSSNYLAIYPPRYEGVMFDNKSKSFFRNEILSSVYGGTKDCPDSSMEEGKIYSSQKIDGCDFFKDWNIHFKYKKDQKIYIFRWQCWNKIEMYEGDKSLANDEKYKDLTIDGKNITDKNSLIQELNACIEKYEKLQSEQPTS